MLVAEADRLVKPSVTSARNCARIREGSYPRQLHTEVGEVTLKVPDGGARCRLILRSSSATGGEKVRRKGGRSAGEMHLGGVSVRRIEDDTEAMWGTIRTDRKSTRLNSSHSGESRMPSSA